MDTSEIFPFSAETLSQVVIKVDAALDCLSHPEFLELCNDLQ
jgi:hypothetical protein